MNNLNPSLTVRELDRDTLWRVLRQQAPVILGFFGLVILAALVGSAVTPREYQAVALIHLMPRSGLEVQTDEVIKLDDGGYLETKDRARTQIQIIQSRPVLEEVLNRYASLAPSASEEESLDSLRERLSAGPREDTQLVEIRILHPSPEHAALLANLVAQVYWEKNLEARRDVAEQTRDWLQGQTAAYQQEVEAASRKVMEFKAQNDLGDVDMQVSDVTARLDALQKALGETTAQRVLLESTLSQHEKLLEAGRFEVLAGMFDDPTLVAMARDRATIITESADVLSRYGERHPDHQRAMERIRNVDGLIAAEVKRKVDEERSGVGILRRQEWQINHELEKVQTELLARQKLKESYEQLKMEEDRARRLYGTLGERGAEVELQARTELSDVRIVEEAVPPSRPARPNIPLNLALSIVVGLGGGLGLGLVRHRLDDRVYTAADLEPEVTVLGAVPPLPGTERERALHVAEHPASLAADAMHGIRAILQRSASAGGCLKLLVTSCTDGEGKTDIAVGLASAFAAMGMKTLLVDANLRQPRLHAVFGLPDREGFVQAIALPLELNTRPTRVHDLYVMTSGVSHESGPVNLWTSPGLAPLFSRLGEGFRVVVVDSSSAGASSDALALSDAVDDVVLVVRQGRPGRGLVLETLGRFRQAGASILGVVLNEVPPSPDMLRNRRAPLATSAQSSAAR